MLLLGWWSVRASSVEGTLVVWGHHTVPHVCYSLPVFCSIGGGAQCRQHWYKMNNGGGGLQDLQTDFVMINIIMTLNKLSGVHESLLLCIDDGNCACPVCLAELLCFKHAILCDNVGDPEGEWVGSRGRMGGVRS